MEASGSPFEKSHRAGAAERAGVAVRNAGQECGKARPPCGGHRPCAMCKAVEGPAGFPGCRNPGRGTRQQRFRPGEGAETRRGGRLCGAERPARDRQGMGGNWGQWRTAKGAGLRPCAMRTRRMRRTPEKNDCSDSCPACRRAGATLVQCPVLRRIRALPAADGGAASSARVSLGA